MERSQTMLMDFDIHIAPSQGIGYYKDIVLLLSDFTRICSLSLTGTHNTIHPIFDSLCGLLPVQCLSLHVPGYEEEFEHIVSDDLFGGKAPIRCLHFVANGRIVMPHLLLHSVTHFTSTEPISPSKLLNKLHQMPALTYLDFHPLAHLWDKIDVDKPHLSPIHMSQLTKLITHTDGDLDSFILLNRLFLLNEGARRRMEIHMSEFRSWCLRMDWDGGLSPLLEAAGGFQHIHFSGAQKKGWLRIWTGCTATTGEDAGFLELKIWNCMAPKWVYRSVSGAMCGR